MLLLSSLILAAFSLGSAAATPSPPIVAETSKVSLAFATRVNATGFRTILAADQARAKALRERGAALASGSSAKRAGVSSFGVTNTANLYTAAVGVGSPPTTYNLLIDTGSSNTWVGASKKYVKTSTSKATGKHVSVDYGGGGFIGNEYTDTVTLSPSLVIKSQSIGVAYSSAGFDKGIDGILGLGPTDLTNATVAGTHYVPTVTDNLLAQHKIPSEILGVFFAPATSTSDKNGELTFGGVDTSKIRGAVRYVPITKTSPASQFWGIEQSVTYGSTPILSLTAGIVDTGSVLILIADDALQRYRKATGATYDTDAGMLKITTAQYKALKPLNFIIGGTTYALSPNAQIWPRALNAVVGGAPSDIFLLLGAIGTDTGAGFDFSVGYTFLERFYCVFDAENGRVGFASTAFTAASSN